jgi:hypothetical protein
MTQDLRKTAEATAQFNVVENFIFQLLVGLLITGSAKKNDSLASAPALDSFLSAARPTPLTVLLANIFGYRPPGLRFFYHLIPEPLAMPPHGRWHRHTAETTLSLTRPLALS